MLRCLCLVINPDIGVFGKAGEVYLGPPPLSPANLFEGPLCLLMFLVDLVERHLWLVASLTQMASSKAMGRHTFELGQFL